MTRATIPALAVLGVALAGIPTAGSTAGPEEGERLYRVHCQACHGEDGTGSGPMRDQLEIDPPDLTTISSRNDGRFPSDKIHQLIDGRLETPAHGSREMPVWGFTFRSAASDVAQEGDVDALVKALTDYLESIQARPTPGAGVPDH